MAGPSLPDDSPAMPPRSKSSQRWLKEHFSDPFVKRAQAEGMRSRAVYKRSGSARSSTASTPTGRGG
jgi:hypothetical protein